jgi:hypothetical protein
VEGRRHWFGDSNMHTISGNLWNIICSRHATAV